MKKLLVFGLLLLPVPTLAPAQNQTAPDVAFTLSSPNERFWSELSVGEKRAWLYGYSDGVKTAAAFVSKAEPDNKLLPECILKFQPSTKLTVGDFIRGIDRFCQDTPENGPVMVVSAFRYVVLKADGATQTELDDFAASLRKQSATPEKNP